MALTPNNGYSALSILYENPKSQKELFALGIDKSSLENLIKEGLILDINKTSSTIPIYKLTSDGRKVVEQMALEKYNGNGSTVVPA